MCSNLNRTFKMTLAKLPRNSDLLNQNSATCTSSLDFVIHVYMSSLPFEIVSDYPSPLLPKDSGHLQKYGTQTCSTSWKTWLIEHKKCLKLQVSSCGCGPQPGADRESQTRPASEIDHLTTSDWRQCLAPTLPSDTLCFSRHAFTQFPLSLSNPVT